MKFVRAFVLLAAVATAAGLTPFSAAPVAAQSPPHDTTPPRLVRGEIDGGTMTLYFSEALDPDSAGGQFDVTVNYWADSWSNFIATGEVVISGNEVTVGLGEGMPRAKPGLPVVARYTRPTDRAAKALRDLAGNPVVAPHFRRLQFGSEWSTTRMITVYNITTGPPTPIDGEVSSDPGEDATYGLGDTIRVRLTFNEAVTVTGSPRLKIDFNSGTGDEKWAVYERGSGKRTLEFAYKVAQGDASRAGIAVLSDTLELNGGTIRSAASSEDAALAHGTISGFSDHRVDTLPPILSRANVDGATLTLIFDEALGGAASLANGSFTVKKTPPGGSEQEVSLSGSPAVAGATVTLTLASPVLETDTDVRVSYARPISGTGNRLTDAHGNEVASLTGQPVTKGVLDATPPRLVRGEIDGGTITLYFSEPLDPDSVGGAFATTVTLSNGLKCTFDATGDVEISGNAVMVGLGSPFGWQARAKAGAPRPPHFSYSRSTDPTAKALRDLAGNPVETPRVQSDQRLRTRIIVLDNLTPATPTVTGVEVSSDAGDDDTYGRGDTIRVTLTFSETVTVTGSPGLKIDMDAADWGDKQAIYEEGSGTNRLTFAYEVAESDLSSAGIAVLANTLALNGGTIESESTAGETAELGHAGLAHDPAHKVDGRVAVTGVAMSSEAGDDDTYAPGDKIQVTLTFSEAVVVTGVPRLKIDLGPGQGDEKLAAYEEGSGAPTLKFTYTVAKGDTSSTGVAVLANTLALNGGTIRSVASGRDVRLTHAGLAHDSKHRVDTTPPTPSTATVDGTALTITFNEPLGAAASLANGAFTVKKTPQGGGEQEVSLSGSPAIAGATVTLTLANAVRDTDTDVKVNYTRPTSGTGYRLRDEAGNEVAGFSDQAVTNVSGDTTPPELVRGEIDGGTMTLYFSEPMDPDSVGGRFQVQVSYTLRAITIIDATGEVAISGNTVAVGLGDDKPHAVAGSRHNFLDRYSPPTGTAARGLQDLAGNAIREIRRGFSLDNVTGVAPAVTGVAVSSDAGGDATYALGEKIRVRLAFGKAVAVTGTPRVRIDFSSGAGDEQWADYEEGSGTNLLTFAYEVAESDLSDAGIAVLANTLALNGGTIESASTAGENAALAHAGLAHDPAHMVDWQASPDSGAGGNGGAVGAGGNDGPATVSGVAVTSDAGADATYALGETIRVTVTFSEAVAVDTTGGTPGLAIDMDPADWGRKQASYESGGGTAALVFAHKVVKPNLSTRGIAVLADTLALNGGSIRSAATGADAALGHAGLAHAASHKVDWRLATDSGPPHDSTPPRLLRGEIDGATMTLTFSEALDPDATGGEFLMGIQTSQTQSLGCYATGEVAVDGATVTVGMGKYCPPARAGLTGRNRVTYFRRADGGDGSLRDLAGNLLAADGDAGVGLYVEIDLANMTGGAPRVTGVAVVSDAGADQTYGGGEEIEVVVTFDRPVDVTGTPRLKIDMDPAEWGEQWAAYERGSGTASLTFVHTVAEPNLSKQGIAVLANTLELSGGTIRAGDAGADMAHAGVAHDANHKVDWQRAAEREPLTARFVDVPATHGGVDSAFSFGLEFSEALERQLSSARLRTEALRATNATVTRTKRVVKGDNRRWTVTVRPETGAEVTVSLPATADCAAAGALCTADGRGLSNAVTATVSPAAASVTGVAVVSTPGEGDTYALGETVRVAVTFSEAVTVTGTPRLKLDLGAGAGKWADYDESSGTNTLEFAWTVARGDASGAGIAVLADTLQLNGGGIRAAARDQAADLAHAGLAPDPSHKVDGAPDTTPPRLSATAVAGTKLTLSFDEAIDGAASPASGAFTVKRTPPGSSEQSVRLSGTPAIEGARVTLTLAEAVRGADTDVKVSYRKSGSEAGNRLRDAAGNEVAGFSDEPVANVNADTTPPELERGEIDGGTVTLYFSEPLDLDSVGGYFRVRVRTTHGFAEYTATGEVTINGRVVTVGLGGTPATAGLPRNYFWYVAPKGPNAVRLQDLAGNVVRTPARLNITSYWSTPRLELDNVTGAGPATVTGVAVSSHAGTDRTYALDETIEVTLTFSEAVNVTGTPRVKIDLSSEAGDEKWADYEEGSGTKTLEFAYKVAQGDVSSAGVAVLANTLELNGGTIRSAAESEDAELAHAGLAHDPKHKVETTAPTPSTATVDGTELTITFNEALGAAGSLANGAFTVKKTPQGGNEQDVSLSGTPAIDGATVTLTVANAVLETDTGVTVSYARPTSGTDNRLRDEIGNEVVSFTDQTVTNGSRSPRLSVASVDWATLTLTFDETLGAAASLATSAFTVKKTPQGGNEQNVSLSGAPAIAGATVTLTLANAVLGTDTDVKVSYARPASGTGNRLRDAAGNEVVSFTDEPVTNGRRPPRLSVASVDGTTLKLAFDEALGAAAMLSNGAFTVKKTPQGSSERTVSLSGSPAIDGAAVTLTLASSVLETDTDVKVSYTRPTTGAGNRLVNEAGNEVVSFTDEPVTNGSRPPRLSVASVDGTTLKLAFDEPLGAAAMLSNGAFTVKKTPQGGNEQDVSLSGSPAIDGATVTLTLADAVRETDTGVKVSYARPTSGTGNRLRDEAGNEVVSFTDEPVTNGSRPPRLSVASVDGATLTLVFDEALGAAASLANGAFTVKKTPQGGGEQEVSLSGSPAISGATVTLTLANAVLETDTDVKVSYARPTSGTANRLRDEAGNEVVSFTDQAAGPDETAPTLVRGEIDGGTMTLYFSEPMDPDSVGGNFRMKVRTSLSVIEFTAKGEVAINGDAVTVGLGSPYGRQLRAKAGVSNNQAHYSRRADPGAKALRDLAGNPVLTPWVITGDEWLRTSVVILDNLTGVAPSVTGVEVSSDAGTDATYGLGEKIRVRLAFSKAVTVTGTPRVKIDFSSGAGGEQWADYEEGSGTKTLDFAYEVAEPNVSTEGIAVLANTLALNGGMIESALTAGENAALAHVGLAHDPAHKVDWQASPDAGGNDGPATVTGVAVTSEAGDDATYGFGETIRVTVTFSEAVTVTGSPELSIDMDPAAWGEKRAAYESGSGTAALVFAYEVVEPNFSTQGIAVLADSLALNGGTIRSAADQADAALGHSGLGHDVAHKVDWRPLISVADARANEGAGAQVAFEVSLSRAFTTAAHSVTVDYATADGTAVAGEDYTATSGTLTFAAGETAKTVDVAVLDDAVDEGEETFVLRLSNATGGRIGDGEATGTIANDDPLQKMWLSRFGRTVAGHVTEAVSDRLGAPLTGARVTVGGESVNLAQTEEGAVLRQALTAVARALGASEQPASGDGTALGVPGFPTRAGASARDVSGRELLDGSAFHLAGEGDGGGPGLAAWGRMTFGGFDGEEGADAGRLSIEGEVTSGILGADVEWNGLLAGVAVSVIEGEGTYSQAGVDTGKIESRMTAVSPYARLKLNERVSVWGLAGWGMGDMTIEQAANEKQVERVTRTDIGMRLGGLGGRGALLEADETGGVDLGLKADAFYVETKAEAISNEGGTTAVASRVRLALEGSGSWETGGGVLTPGVEFGVRNDGGDAETGTGVEIGGSVRYTDPAAGLSVEARVRTLLAHEDTEYREWGASGAVRLAPGDRGRGVSFSLAPTYGTASSGVERLWSARDARGLTPGDGGFEPERRLEGELGYGLALFGDRFTGTPNLGFGVTDGSRDYRIGWRLTSAVSGAAGFEVSLDATRRETVGDSGPVSEAEHGVMLRGAIRW